MPLGTRNRLAIRACGSRRGPGLALKVKQGDPALKLIYPVELGVHTRFRLRRGPTGAADFAIAARVDFDPLNRRIRVADEKTVPVIWLWGVQAVVKFGDAVMNRIYRGDRGIVGCRRRGIEREQILERG